MTREDDVISRQSVLNKIKEVCFSEEWVQFRIDKGSNGQRDFLINYIEQLPSITLQHKIGHWIEVHPLQEDDGGAYMCSECRCGHPYIAPHWKYCPNCGAKMIEQQKSEDKNETD